MQIIVKDLAPRIESLFFKYDSATISQSKKLGGIYKIATLLVF
jgi:hypothetical protein